MKFNCGGREYLLIIGAAGLGLLLVLMVRRPEPALPPPRVAPATRPASPAVPPTNIPPAAATLAAPTPSDPLREWKSAVQRQDKKGVLGAQSLFLSREEEYRDPLMKLARDDGDPRVRSFSVAVLGRMKTPPPESFFLEKLADPQEYPRTSALQALERLGTPACLATVDGLAASDPADAVKAAAARTAKAVRSR